MSQKEIVGKTTGLKRSQIELLEALYTKHQNPHEVIAFTLAKALSEAARELRRYVGVLLNRKAQIEYVVLGEQERLYLPDIGRLRADLRRLRGLSLMVARPPHTKNLQTKSINSDLILDLERLQLDYLVQIQSLANHQIGSVLWAHLDPYSQSHTRHKQFIYDFNNPIDVSNTIKEIEQVLQTQKQGIRQNKNLAVLIGAYTTPKKIWDSSIKELQELAKTAGVQIVNQVVQQRKNLDPRTVVGTGKLEEICLDALHKGAEILIFDCDLSPSQLNIITDLTDLKILDRTMLILDIFAKRATTRSGKAQVELAQLQYSLPRLAKKQTGLSRLTGGIGGQGPGETKLEIDKRRVKDKITRLEREIDQLQMQGELRRQKRKEEGLPVIALVGYTNAGKSTLLNALTHADAYVKNELFATLDPMWKRLRFPKERDVILTDTVGFIRDLPEGLLNAFRATLEELHHADLLLHVVDASDQDKERQIQTVQQILQQIGVDHTKRLLIFNKCDLLPQEDINSISKKFDAVPISASQKTNLNKLLKIISKNIFIQL